MRLEAVTAELRPRSDWEAVDLGLALVRREFRALSAAWWMGMLPVLLVLPLMVKHPFWYCLLFWWWVPVGSRLALFKLSRRLFGDAPGWGELWRELPRAMVRRFFHRMILARFSPWRPLTMPVEDLEGLRGKDYSTRCRVLMRRGDSTVIVLAMWRLFLVLWLGLAVFFTGALMLPQGVEDRWGEALSLWWEGDRTEAPLGICLAVVGSLCLSMWLVDLFSVGAGFGIYVNHRTWIEGWDVELAFRRLSNRLRGVTALLAGLLLVLGCGNLKAADRDVAKDSINEVLSDEDFIIHSETYKEWVSSSSSGSGGSGFGAFFEAMAGMVKVLALVAALALLAWLLYRFRHVFAGRGGASVPKVHEQARVVMGMDVAPEALPDDIAVAALALWRDGRRHEAMALLYRGAISWMINRAGIEITESDTESDCVRRVRDGGAGHAEYFDGVTRQWMRLAYAREIPGDEEIEALCGHWPFSERGAT